jgi:hypothetical protein
MKKHANRGVGRITKPKMGLVSNPTRTRGVSYQLPSGCALGQLITNSTRASGVTYTNQILGLVIPPPSSAIT